jgi:hypothetical protein
MNIDDKAGLYREARRILVSGGRLAIWDITTGERGELDYPVPWADQRGVNHLVTSDKLRAVIESSGFAIDQWNDLTDQAATTMQMVLTLPPNPLGLHAFVTEFAQKAQNPTLALADGRLHEQSTNSVISSRIEAGETPQPQLVGQADYVLVPLLVCVPTRPRRSPRQNPRR